MAHLNQIIEWFSGLQDRICKGLEDLDGSGKLFQEDKWTREEGGGGRTRVFLSGNVIEKGGVNFSHVHGHMPDKISDRLELKRGSKFHATGVSIVLHSSHPLIPIIHMNVRYFEIENGHYWFGGGIDVTPAYVNVEQAQEFHRELKMVCDRHDPEYYTRFKHWCDEYFYLPHRKEARGIGGLFFDHQKGETEAAFQALWAFVQDIGNAFVPRYTALVEANRHQEFTPAQREWQFHRRGRYVEFNLLFDKGTKFGIDTGGRTASILMSLPPTANWDYNYQPASGSPEAETLTLLQPNDWLKLEPAL